ncbi:hypothetical protein F4703DRAFT_1419780 [Phycomyces blakesleeanus]
MLSYQEYDHTLDQSVHNQLNYPAFQYMDSSCHITDNTFRSTNLMDIKSTNTCAADYLEDENMIGQQAHEKHLPLYLDPSNVTQQSGTMPPISPVYQPCPTSYFSFQSLGNNNDNSNHPSYSPLSIQCVPSTPSSSYSLPLHPTSFAITPASTHTVHTANQAFYHPPTNTPVNDYPSPLAWQYTPMSEIISSSQDSLSSSSFSFDSSSSSSFLPHTSISLSHEAYPPYTISASNLDFELAMPPKRRGLLSSSTAPLTTIKAQAQAQAQPQSLTSEQVSVSASASASTSPSTSTSASVSASASEAPLTIAGSAGAARGLSKAIQSRKKRVYAHQENETPARNLILKSVPEDPTLDIDKGSMDSTK